MLSRWGWNDRDASFAFMNEFRRRMDRMFEDVDATHPSSLYESRNAWPRTWLVDTGASLLLRAEVPGLSEKDLQITVNQDVLTLSAERTTPVPEGYTVHRQERPSTRFTRSFALPTKVDLEKTTAVVKNGVLTVTLPRAPEVQPRQISVKAV